METEAAAPLEATTYTGRCDNGSGEEKEKVG
jgi:hypothetical protein